MAEDNNYKGPDDLVEDFFTYLSTTGDGDTTLAEQFETKIPHLKALTRKLVWEAFRASLQAEENRAVRLQLFFDSAPQQVTLPFDSPMEYTAQNLVKLAPTINLGFRWLVVAREPLSLDTEPKIFGICDPALSPSPLPPLNMHLKDLPGIKISILGPGWVRLETWGGQTFDLCNCQLDRPCTINIIPSARAWYKEAVKTLVLGTPRYGIDVLLPSMLMGVIGHIWINILKKVCDAHHGGTFLIVPDQLSLSHRLKNRYSVDSMLLIKLMQKRADLGLQSYTPQVQQLFERDMEHLSDLIAALAAIDGAVVLHRNLKIIGFGVEILPQIEEQSSSETFVNRGMRHRSASRFCSEVQGSLAFVVSQDGGVTLVLNENGKVEHYTVATPEHGWVVPGINSRTTSELA